MSDLGSKKYSFGSLDQVPREKACAFALYSHSNRPLAVGYGASGKVRDAISSCRSSLAEGKTTAERFSYQECDSLSEARKVAESFKSSKYVPLFS